jgi:ribosomal protein L7/L12
VTVPKYSKARTKNKESGMNDGIAMMAMGFAAGAFVAASSATSEVKALRRRIDALLAHHGVVIAPSDAVRRLAVQGNRIGAIRLHRKETGLGLKEAKDEIETLIGS